MGKSAMEYIRIATNYYKKVRKPLISGDELETYLPWSLDTIKQDNPKNWRELLEKIERYDGRCIIPAHHEAYKRVHNSFLNTYEELPYLPIDGECSVILSFLEHIFGDQLIIGLDYLTLIYRYPTHLLPVLCLVSKERGTGKTTFINLLKSIYGKNMTFNTNEDFRSPFNSDWVSKLIIAVDEVFLDRKEDSERIKNLATARSYKAEAKGQDRVEVEFFGKFILCSNNEDNFIVIDPAETRYWVRKINPLNKIDPNLMESMVNEIPQFLNLLQRRKIIHEKQTRMWFSPEQILTPALKKIKSQFVPKIEMEILECIRELIDNKELEEFCFTNNDLKLILKRSGFNRIRTTDIRNIIENNWKLEQYLNSSNYRTYRFDDSGFLLEIDSKGRYYKLKRSRMLELFDDLLT